MELQLENRPSGYCVGSFANNTVVIDEVSYTTSLIVTPKEVILDWSPQQLDELTVDDLGIILNLEPELILVGTGNVFRFPDPVILKGVMQSGIGIDFMDSRAVCRTYNILALEGRHVAAGIIIDRSTNAS